MISFLQLLLETEMSRLRTCRFHRQYIFGGNYMKRLVFLSLSLLLLVILIPGCFTFQTPPPVTIPPAGTPSVIGIFSSNPPTINAGGTSTLLWNVTGANSVSIDQGIGLVDAAGTRVVSPTKSTVYTMSATNSAGTTVTRS